MVKISVIIPVYNVEKYLDECINSVVNQSYKNLEIILVDDGSPDNCPKLCDEWAKKDDRIKVIHKKNGGLSSARNAGLEILTGDYFTFVDSDDYIDLDYIKILYEDIEKTGADVSIVSHIRFKEPIVEQKKTEEYEAMTGYHALHNLMWWHKDYSVAWGKLYKSEKYKQCKFIEGKLNEDEFYINDIYHNARTVVHNDSELYFYRITPNSIINRPFTSAKMTEVECLEYRDDFLVQHGYTEFLKQSRLSILRRTATLYNLAKKAGYKKEAVFLKKKFNKWYKVDKSEFSKKEKFTLGVFRISPFLYFLIGKINRGIKCKKK